MNTHNPPGPAEGNVQVKQNTNTNSQSNQPHVIRHPHPPGVHPHAGVHQQPGANIHPSVINAPHIPPPQGQSQQIYSHQPCSNLHMHNQPSQSSQLPHSISSGMRMVNVNVHQLPTQQQPTIASNYTPRQQSRYPTQSSKPLQYPANYQLQSKGGNQVYSQYLPQADLISSQYPSSSVGPQMNSPHHPLKLQQPSAPQLAHHSVPSHRQNVPQHQFPPHVNNQLHPSTNPQFSSQLMENQSQIQYTLGSRQCQHSSIHQSALHPKQQRKPPLQQQFQQPPQQYQQYIQSQKQQPSQNLNLVTPPHQLRQHEQSLMQKNIPAQQNIVISQQTYDNTAKFHNQSYERMGDETSPIIDLLADNSILPLPLIPEKTGEKAEKHIAHMLPHDDSSMIYPRNSVNDSIILDTQPNCYARPTIRQIQQTEPVSQTPAFINQESNELIYPRLHPQENQVSSFVPNSNYPGHTDVVSNRGQPIVEGHNSNNTLNIVPSAPMNQGLNQTDFPNHISSHMPYSGQPISQSNSLNRSGLLFASKPMMSPTMTPPHDPVISNILGKNMMPNIDMTHIAQFNLQQIHLQNMVIQQQQLIAMLQNQQNQQRSEEENKIQLLQQQIDEQQKLIDGIKEQKEKEEKNTEFQAFLDYERASKKMQTEEQARQEKEDCKDEIEQLGNEKVNLVRDSASVISTSSLSTPPAASVPCTMIENGVRESSASGNSNDLPDTKKDFAQSVIVNASVSSDVLNLGKENSNSGNPNTTALSDVISDNIQDGNITNDQMPFYEPKLDNKNTDDDLSLIVPREMEETVEAINNDDVNVATNVVSDDDDNIIQPRSGHDNFPLSTDINAHTKPKLENDDVVTDQKSAEVNDSYKPPVENEISTIPQLNEASSSTSFSVRKSFKDGSIFSSPNTSRCSSEISTPNASGRSSPAPSSNSQCVQLDEIDNKEHDISEPIDHRHLARQLGRMSFYVAGPEETVWLTYIQELDVAISQLQIFCKSLCKRVENMDVDGFLKIWNDLAKVEELDVRNLSSTVGESNISKNRYRDILPWDHTRVKLLSSPNDYINANSIQNLTPHSPHYIATQGPIPQTFSDFWTMVWEQKSQIIIMLTNEVEGTKLKCHHYWGREVDSRIEFDNLIIILIDETTTSGWKIRTFSIVDKHSDDTRMVKQFQFTSWPDYGTPESPYELLTFMEDIYQCHQQLESAHQSPIILHCSAGVGRTGSFCCIYSAIREMQGQNGLIDIPGVIRKLRQYRPHMVQRKEQLIFCYQAVLCFAQQFTATEMQKISNQRFQDNMQSVIQISNEHNPHNEDIETLCHPLD